MERRGFLKRVLWGLAVAGGSSVLPSVAAAAETSHSAYLSKMRDFDVDHPADVMLSPQEMDLLRGVVAHLRRVQATIGYGNFHILGFDEMLRMARRHPSLERFEQEELMFMERTFYENARHYGFLGHKVLTRVTDQVPGKDLVKIGQGGQFLFRGESQETYRAIKRHLGNDVVLTSGVRSVVKQMYLFLNKALRTGGNLSRASRSLAPPGYSFHAIGDFDVGKPGLGRLNFTRAFAETDVFKQLQELGFVAIRYPQDNLLGVRYEPWHIKVI